MTTFFDSIIMLRFSNAKVAKEECYWAKKKKKNWDVDDDNIFNSKKIETKNSSKYMTGYLDEATRPLVFILPKWSVYFKTFEEKNNKLTFFCVDDYLLEKYKSIQTKIEDIRNIELNATPVYDDRYTAKVRTYSDKVYTNLHGLNALKDGVECESFTIIYTELIVLDLIDLYQIYS